MTYSCYGIATQALCFTVVCIKVYKKGKGEEEEEEKA